MNSDEFEEWVKESGGMLVYKASEMDKVCTVYILDGGLHVLRVNDQPATKGGLPS